jgi:signal transduction histidine kinase
MTRPTSIISGSTCEAMVQGLPHAVLLVDEHLRVVIANFTAAKLFQTPLERLRGLPVAALVPHAGLEALSGESSAKPITVLEVPLPGKERRRTPITVKITAVRLALAGEFADSRWPGDPAFGRMEFRLLVIEDITDKAMLEQQLVETEKQVAMGQLAAGILHEVNNPVVALGSNLYFIREAVAGTAAPEVAQALDASLEQLDQMRQMLGTLAGFTGRQAPRYQWADVHDVVRGSVAFLARDAERRGVRVSVTFAPASLRCEIDVRQIRQVLLNLLKNALEAMPDGGRLDIRTSRRDGGHTRESVVSIEIADTGTGIAPTDLRKVFRPLFSTKPRGAGLGLSFCRQAVEEHGGDIRLANRHGEPGTVANITLPTRQTGAGREWEENL